MTTLQRVNGASLVADASPSLNLLLQSQQDADANQAASQAQQAIQNEINTIAGGGDQEAALLRISAINPKIANSMRQVLERGDKQELAEIQQATEEGTKTALFIQSQPDFISRRKALTQEAHAAAGRGEDISRFIELSNLPEGELDNELRRMVIQGADLKTLTTNALKTQTGSFTKSTGVIVKQPDGSFAQSIPVLNQQTGQIEQKLVPIDGQPVSRIGETGQQLTDRKIQQAEGVETAKLKVGLKIKPQIEAAVTEARAIAAEKGEVFTDLQQMRAALPGLKQTVEALRELAPIATSTFAGKVFNLAVKETGFGATKGSTARAKFIAIIDNQVLPLLKPTFGAAFTETEGKALRATLGDPDASPTEKMAQLDAFIEQKVRSIEEKESQRTSQLGGGTTTAPSDATPTDQPAEIIPIMRFNAQGQRIQ